MDEHAQTLHRGRDAGKGERVHQRLKLPALFLSRCFLLPYATALFVGIMNPSRCCPTWSRPGKAVHTRIFITAQQSRIWIIVNVCSTPAMVLRDRYRLRNTTQPDRMSSTTKARNLAYDRPSLETTQHPPSRARQRQTFSFNHLQANKSKRTAYEGCSVFQPEPNQGIFLYSTVSASNLLWACYPFRVSNLRWQLTASLQALQVLAVQTLVDSVSTPGSAIGDGGDTHHYGNWQIRQTAPVRYMNSERAQTLHHGRDDGNGERTP
ncbi:hypothetical protein BC835DRAFT_652168 [Cytidiella melzeri]|nr:hypothetical protein BC835DRAFT_652168 [Cytidiella melzeri]